MNRDAMFHQTTQVTIDQLMVSDRVRRTTKFRSQVAEAWVIGRRVDRHACAGEQDEFTPFLCVNHCLRQIYIGEAHSVPLRPILWESLSFLGSRQGTPNPFAVILPKNECREGRLPLPISEGDHQQWDS